MQTETTTIVVPPTRYTSTGKWEDRGTTLVFTAPIGVPITPVAFVYGECETEHPTAPPTHNESPWVGSHDLADLLSYVGQKTWVRKADLIAIASLWVERRENRRENRSEK